MLAAAVTVSGVMKKDAFISEMRASYQHKFTKKPEEHMEEFKHLFKPGNEHLIEEFQKEVDRRWENLLYKCDR